MNIKELTLDVGGTASCIYGGGVDVSIYSINHQADAKQIFDALILMDEAQATIKTLRDELAHKTRRVEYLEKVIIDINKSLKGRCDEK